MIYLAFWYKVRRIATVIGGAIFLLFGFATFVLGGEIYEQLKVVWDGAKIALICLATTIGGGMFFVWGMGWTMSSKERSKMNKHRQLEKEKTQKTKELERKRKRLLRKHGLETK